MRIETLSDLRLCEKFSFALPDTRLNSFFSCSIN
jgi:hypothetical protein